MQGAGFRFEAPAGWSVTRGAASVSASDGSVDLLRAQHYTLVKTYRPDLFEKAGTELDRTAATLAAQNRGRVAATETMVVAGRKSWYYRIDYGVGKTEEIAFVLQGKDEYYLLCRREARAGDADCQRLFSTFALG